MPDYFEATESAAAQGLANTEPSAGADLVAGWASELEAVDLPSAKALQGDLMLLHEELQSVDPDAEKVNELLGRLGPATTQIAEDSDDPQVAEKLRSLGEALTTA